MPPVDRRCGAGVHACIRVGQREPDNIGDLAIEDLLSAERSSPAILRDRKKVTAILLREQRDREPVGEEDYCRQFDPMAYEVGASVDLGFYSHTVRNELDFFDGDSARADGNPGKEHGRCARASEKRGNPAEAPLERFGFSRVSRLVVHQLLAGRSLLPIPAYSFFRMGASRSRGMLFSWREGVRA